MAEREGRITLLFADNWRLMLVSWAMLVRLIWGGSSMGSVSFLILFLLSVLSFPKEGTGHPPSPGDGAIPNCPPSALVLPNNTGPGHPICSPFQCKQLGSVRYPFNNESYPECGLMTVGGCTPDDPIDGPWIQLEQGGRYFQVKNISDDDSIVVRSWWQHPSRPCEFIQNLTSSFPLQLAPTLTELTLFKCHRSLTISLNTDYTYDGCDDDFIIHYNRPNNSAPIPPLPPPPKCLIIQYPVDKRSDMADLAALLFSYITIQLHFTRDSRECHQRGDQCRDDEKEKLPCPYVTVAAVKAANREETEDLPNHMLPKRDPKSETEESPNQKPPPPPNPEAEPGNHKPPKPVLIFAISGGSIAFLIAFLVIYLFIRRGHKRKYVATALSSNTSSDPSSRQGLEMPGAYYGIPIFAYSELEEATNYFDPNQEIGNGGFGVVYHGQLRDGREVAVKRLFESNCKQVALFLNEIEILTSLRHPNLVSLYGCTSRHSRELLLVYEYIPNGTVADHLHGNQTNSGLLTWPIRLSIAIETASALCYLHASDVIHRDVKTNNILLDNGFHVKVADFGLSRLFPLDATHVSTAPQGTPGYVDPEYHQCYQLTEKSDVYSFGVVLVELLSSLPAVDLNRHRHEINLSNYAINKIQQCAFQELMDPSLGFDTDAEVNRMTTLVAELAFRCLQPDKEGRPSMDEVLEVLKEIKSDKNGSSHPLPPSPDCDEVVLLKSVQSTPLPPKPLIVEWQSRSSIVVRSV